MGFMDFTSKRHTYAKRASLTYEEVLYFYESGIKAAHQTEAVDKKTIEDEVFDKIHVLFPERRSKTLNWREIDQVLAPHVPLEVRSKLLGKMFQP